MSTPDWCHVVTRPPGCRVVSQVEAWSVRALSVVSQVLGVMAWRSIPSDIASGAASSQCFTPVTYKAMQVGWGPTELITE